MFFRDKVEFGGEDDGHDDAVDGDDFAEDDGDEVLGADAGRFDAATENGGAGDEDAPIEMRKSVSLCGPLGRGSNEEFVPCSSYNGEADAEAYAEICPCVWRDCF